MLRLQPSHAKHSPPENPSARAHVSPLAVKIVAWVAFVVGAALTATAAREVHRFNVAEANMQFAAVADQVTVKVSERLKAYSLILKGAAGLFAASDEVKRSEWRDYVAKLRAGDSVPGVQGIGFAVAIPPANLAGHIAAVRQEGFGDYTVRPSGPRELYTSIVYLEPFRDRNLRAFGYDMWSEPVRRQAMERARDTGEASLSGRVVLVQEVGTNVQAGTLLYVPVYRSGQPTTTADERRRALLGWTYSPYRMEDLLTEILADWCSKGGARVSLRLYDGPQTSPAELLFRSQPSTERAEESSEVMRRSIQFGGRDWLLVFDEIAGARPAESGTLWGTLLGGLLLSSLLAALVHSLASTQQRAERIAVELTAEVRAGEAALRASERRYHLIYDSSPLPMWVFDEESRRFLTVNEKAVEFYGYTQQEFTEMTLCQLRPTEDLPQCEIDLASTHNGFASYRARHLTKAGKLVVVEVDTAPIQYEGERARLVHVRDITASIQAEAALAEYRKDLENAVRARTAELATARDVAEAASRAKSTFLANMSHELRTPMNAIIGFTGLALRLAVEPRLVAQLSKIAKASGHLLQVINDILDISQIEAGRLTLVQRDFTVGELLDDVVSLLQPRCAEKGLILRAKVASELGRLVLCGDGGRLAQVLLNLGGNAVKFTDAGSVTLSVQLIRQLRGAVELRFDVTDTGIGIAAADQQRLFMAFEQADTSLTRKYGGTGLGLAISKRLVQRLGGEIGVISEPGGGSTFWFTLQIAQATSKSAAPKLPPRQTYEERLQARYSGTMVLLAEDEPMNQEVACGLLAEVGLKVDLATDGQQAVARAATTKYALVLMDMQMPVLNGVEATRAIRALPGYGLVPILAMTASALTQDRAECLAAGMNDHIAKPIEPEALYATILKWLDEPAAATRRADDPA